VEFEIVLKNARIFAEKMILRRVERKKPKGEGQ
jgi:CO dehydrogenase/acetyl-CoA synthase beta subunit